MQTFLVRVWTPAASEGGAAPAAIHGVVEHVGSKSSRPFEGERDLVLFIHDCLGGHQEGICSETGPRGSDSA